MSDAVPDNDVLIAVYDREAKRLSDEWGATASEFDGFRKFHAPYLPKEGGRALDIGAGYGAQVQGLEKLGMEVIAVEPAAGMRREAAARYPTERAIWLDDRLPQLEKVRALGYRFDFMLMNSVWMHLHPDERDAGMKTFSELLAPGGYFSVLLRHGPAPADRPMHVADTDPFLTLAEKHGLSCVYRGERNDELNRAGVSFTRLILTTTG